MEAMIPVFNGLPQAALDIMAIALNKLPAQVFQKVTALVTATGGVGDAMAAKVAPVPSIRKEAADMQLDTQGEADTYFKARDAKCPNKTACKEDEAGIKVSEQATLCPLPQGAHPAPRNMIAWRSNMAVGVQVPLLCAQCY